MAQMVKNPPAMQETWVQSLGWEDTLEKGMATHSSILAWRIPWTVCGVTKSWTRLSDFHFQGAQASHGHRPQVPSFVCVLLSGPITSRQIDGETMETVTDFILGGSKITADGDCSHEIKRRLLLGRKAMTNLESILKSRNITLPTKVYQVKAMVFPVVMYGCESWSIKKAEHQRIDAFKLWCWRRPLRVPWTARRSNQFILKEISPAYSVEGLILKLKILWPPDAKN